MSEQEESKTWLEKLSLALSGEPSSRAELLELLRSAEQRALLDGEALSIIEGALTVSDMQVREIASRADEAPQGDQNNQQDFGETDHGRDLYGQFQGHRRVV